MKITQTLLAAAIMLTATSTTQAALSSALNGLVINDSDLNVTWLANANLAATNTFGISGIGTGGAMTWITAQNWIGAMNAANYLGFNDWRLPTTLNMDTSCSSKYYGAASNTSAPPTLAYWGYNCAGSEMGHLFYNELGGMAGSDIATTNNANYSLFNNIKLNHYWSGTEYAPNTSGAWEFFFINGSQDYKLKGLNYYALAVRSGQVTSVPIPSAAWLLGSGLLGLASIRHKRKAA